MPTRAFPRHDLEDLLRAHEEVLTSEDGVVYTFLTSEETDDVPAGTDNLGLWNTLIFEVDGVAYRCWYIDGNSYWRAESGEQWDSPFVKRPNWVGSHPDRYTLTPEDTVVCTAVRKQEVVTYVWVEA